MNCWCDWSEIKWKQMNWIISPIYHLVLPPHWWNWPSIFKVKAWKRLSPGMGEPMDVEQKGYESVSHDHDHDIAMGDHGGMDRCTGWWLVYIQTSGCRWHIQLTSWTIPVRICIYIFCIDVQILVGFMWMVQCAASCGWLQYRILGPDSI